MCCVTGLAIQALAISVCLIALAFEPVHLSFCVYHYLKFNYYKVLNDDDNKYITLAMVS